MDAHIPVANADEPIEEQDDQQSTEQDAMMVNENNEVNNNNDADRGFRERSGILGSNKIACYVGSAVLGWVLFFIFLIFITLVIVVEKYVCSSLMRLIDSTVLVRRNQELHTHSIYCVSRCLRQWISMSTLHQKCLSTL